jgi:hypothetical protein
MRTKSRLTVTEDEPRLKPAETESIESQLSKMFTWYNYNRNGEDAKKYFVEFLRQSGEPSDTLTQIEECSTLPLSSTIGWLCRIKIINGERVPASYNNNIEKEKMRVLQVALAKKTVEEKPQVEKKPSVQDHLENQLRELLSDLAVKVDEFVETRGKASFNAYDWLQSFNVKHQHAKSIADYFEKNLLNELRGAESGECEQLVEAYSFLKKAELKKFIAFVESIVEESRKWSDVAKQISLNNRAPRAKKPKSPLKQVAKLKYLKEHEGLKSIPPTQICGATQLWIYNTKYRTLGVYICNNAHGFSVKGCTILNYDATESIAKKLRKPEEVLPKVLESGKVALRKILPNVRSKEKKLTGRINGDTILLKVV